MTSRPNLRGSNRRPPTTPPPPTPPDPTTDAAAGGPAAGVPEGALVVGHGHVPLRDHATVDVLCAVLFAGLGSTRRSGSDRAGHRLATPRRPIPSRPVRLRRTDGQGRRAPRRTETEVASG